MSSFCIPKRLRWKSPKAALLGVGEGVWHGGAQTSLQHFTSTVCILPVLCLCFTFSSCRNKRPCLIPLHYFIWGTGLYNGCFVFCIPSWIAFYKHRTKIAHINWAPLFSGFSVYIVFFSKFNLKVLRANRFWRVLEATNCRKLLLKQTNKITNILIFTYAVQHVFFQVNVYWPQSYKLYRGPLPHT